MSSNNPKAIYIHGSTPDEQHRLSQLNKLLNSRCLSALQLQGGEKILDVGCGLGQFSLEMAKRIGKTGTVIGIERDSKQLEKAINYTASSEKLHNIHFRQGNAYSLPLNKEDWGTFDLVHTRFLLEHLSQPKKAVAQMVKAAKKGGRIILSDDDHATYRPTPEPMGFSLIWTAYCRSYERLGNDPYIGKKLVTLLHQNGISKIRNGSIFFGGCQGDGHFSLVALNLIGILEGAKQLILKEGLLDTDSFEQAIQSLHHWKNLPDAALNYSIDWAEGTK